MTIEKLIEQAKEKANIESDYKLAQALGISRAIVSQWKSGTKHPSTTQAIQLATLAKMDEMEVIARIEAATAKTPEKRKFWTDYIEKRGLAALASMWILAGSITASPDAEAVLQSKNYAANGDFLKSGIYIIRMTAKRNFLILRAFWRKVLEITTKSKVPYVSIPPI
jgi:transcriptional regulator with XRE-family HTH domain